MALEVVSGMNNVLITATKVKCSHLKTPPEAILYECRSTACPCQVSFDEGRLEETPQVCVER